MRIAIVSRIYRPEPAAASLFLGAVADELLAAGHEVDVYTARPPKNLTPETHGEQVFSRAVLRDKTGYVRGYMGYMSFDIPLIFRLLFARKPDAVFVEPPPTTGAVVRVICALRRIPYVYDAADIWSDAAQLEGVPNLVIRVLRFVEKFALRGAAHTVTVSEGVVKRVRELGVRRPVTVTGFGADVHQFPLTLAENEKLFVYAGSYAPSHGADVLLEAFAQFSAEHPGYKLRFIGNGVVQAELEALGQKLGIADQVEYLAPVSPQELLPHLGAARASLATIKPGTIYEYAYASKAFSSLMTGCPVIFAGPGPTVQIIDDANTQVRAGRASAYSAAEVAAAMAEFAQHPASDAERRELADWAAKNHSLQAVAGRVAGIIAGAARSVARR